jgi:pentatricopeptide repeat protein
MREPQKKKNERGLGKHGMVETMERTRKRMTKRSGKKMRN